MHPDPYLQQLISIPSVCGDAVPSQEIITLCAAFFEERGMHVVQFLESGFSSLVATTQATKTPTVMLTAHLDVVAGGEELFNLRYENGKYYGRGVFDMKFAAAAYMHLIDELAGKLDQYDIGIMLTTDEEMYGEYGTGMLIKKGYIPKVCVLPDGADSWNIETFAKGRWFAEVSVPGVSAHGSRPWEGDSASLKLIELLSKVTALFSDGQKADTPTLNVGTIQSGTMVNQIPSRAMATLDIRFNAMEELEKLKTTITEICRHYSATLTSMGEDSPPVSNNPADPFITAFRECIVTETGILPRYVTSYGASDVRFFNARGVPAIITRPHGGGQHANSEWLDAAGYDQFRRILRAYVNKTAR